MEEDKHRPKRKKAIKKLHNPKRSKHGEKYKRIYIYELLKEMFSF